MSEKARAGIKHANVGGYKRYPAYKDSGVEWLGEVPEHWDIAPIKRFVRIRNGKEYAQVYDPNGKCPVYGSGGVFSTASQSMYEGESVLIGRKGTLDKPLHVYGPFWTIDTMFYTELYPNIVGRLFYYNMLCFPTSLYATDTALPSLTQSDIASHLIAIPYLPEQRLIAAYLDRETASIDALISKKGRLIELLEEKRQALISHAVTKGLDPNVKMKDSGVEWLGEVPAHWEVVRFQRIVTIRSGQVRPGDTDFLDQVLIAPNHIESGTGRLLQQETARDQSAISGKYQVEDGDIIYSKIRPALRKACMSPGRVLCSADMYGLSATPKLNNYFLLYFLLSETFSAYAVLEAERVAMPKINRESLNAIYLPVPPMEEQLDIAQHIEAETASIDTLLTKTRRSIELLQEKRSALITAAVTGQIDLRGEFADA